MSANSLSLSSRALLIITRQTTYKVTSNMNSVFLGPLLMQYHHIITHRMSVPLDNTFITEEFTFFDIWKGFYKIQHRRCYAHSQLWNLKKRPRNHKSLSISYISYNIFICCRQWPCFWSLYDQCVNNFQFPMEFRTQVMLGLVQQQINADPTP